MKWEFRWKFSRENSHHRGGQVSSAPTFVEISRTQRPIRFIFPSTSAVYGNPQQRAPIQEDAFSCAPISFYGAQKLASEAAIRMFHRHHSVPAMIFRLFNVYGPGQKSDSAYSGVITIFRDAAARGDSLVLHGDGSQLRDFISIRDVVDAFSKALFLGLDNFTAEPINIGSSQPISVRDLALLVSAFAGKPLALHRDVKRSGDIDYSCANTNRANSLLGWEASVGLPEGLRELFEESTPLEGNTRQRSLSVVTNAVCN